jgi:hypothetical protein
MTANGLPDGLSCCRRNRSATEFWFHEPKNKRGRGRPKRQIGGNASNLYALARCCLLAAASTKAPELLTKQLPNAGN